MSNTPTHFGIVAGWLANVYICPNQHLWITGWPRTVAAEKRTDYCATCETGIDARTMLKPVAKVVRFEDYDPRP